MIQLQYYNNGLTKTQIEQILNNYNLKYNTLTNEINSKLNNLIKTFLNDIFPFLENIEYISKEMKKLKNLETNRDKIEFLENQLNEKCIIENQLQNDIITLKKYILFLENKNKRKNNENISSIDKTNNKIINNNDKNIINYKENNFKNEMGINEKYPFNLKLSITSKNSPKNKENKIRQKLNLEEITQDLSGYYNKIQSARNSEKINKFISFSKNKNIKNIKRNNFEEKEKEINLKEDENKNKDKEIENKENIKEIIEKNINDIFDDKYIEEIREKIGLNDLSRNSQENNDYQNDNNNNDNEKDKEDDIIEDINNDIIDEEIKELEIEEEDILMLIEDIKKFAKEDKN